MSNQNLIKFLTTVEFMAFFSRKELTRLAGKAQHSAFEVGNTICSAGENCAGLSVIKSGSVRVFSEESGKETDLGIRKKGEVFGELAALREHKHEASIRAFEKTEIVFIPSSELAPVVAKNRDVEAKITNYVAMSSAGGFVTRLFDLKGKLDQKELENVVRSVGVKKIPAGTTILEQDSTDDRRLYIIRQGVVKILVRDQGKEYPIASLSQGEVFGERASLSPQPQPASVAAATDVVLLMVPEATVHSIVKRNPKLKDVLEERIAFFDNELESQKNRAQRRTPDSPVDLISEPGIGERLIKRFPLIQQAQEFNCGTACVSMICKHYGIDIPTGKLRELTDVATQGPTLDSLAHAGEALGFTTRGIQCAYASLLEIELPFVANLEGNHPVVVYGVSKRHVWIADPDPGFRKLTRDEFEKAWTGNCLLFSPTDDLMHRSPPSSSWSRFLRSIGPYKKTLGYLFMATFVIQVLGVAPPVIIQNILDRVVVHNNFSLLNLLIVGLVIATLFSQLTSALRSLLSAYMVRNLEFSMMSGFFKHTLSLPMSFFATRHSGDIFARFQENQVIRRFLTESTVATVLNLLMVLIYFAILFMYNARMTLLLIAFVIPIIALTVAVTPRLKQYARETFLTATDVEAVLMETIGGAETIKGMGIERAMRLKWERKYTRSLNLQYRAQRFGIFVGLASQLLAAATTIVILWYGANLVLAQQLTIGQLVAFNSLMGSVLSPLMGLIGVWNQVQEAGVALERLGDVLEIEPEQNSRRMASRVSVPDLQGNIQFEQVSFRYDGEEGPYVLKDINFAIKPGELVAIVGPSGSGKSTLAKLLLGFYPPTKGRMTVDGYDFLDIDKQSFRTQVGYVMQENRLFSGSIAENIAAGEENPDLRRIMEAAKLADAHGFIGAMPLGYKRVIAERGMDLSGGEIQGICIARAFYRDPRLLIFDEATSALNTQSESKIFHNIQKVMRDRTAVVIAHRLSTVIQADKILVLDQGSIVEQGTHEALLDQRGMYTQLMQPQMVAGSEVYSR